MMEHAAYAAGLLRHCLLCNMVIVTAYGLLAVVVMAFFGNNTTIASVVRLDIRTVGCLIT